MSLKAKLTFVFGLIFLMCLSVSSQIMAQDVLQRTDRITKSQANKFYETCMGQGYPANSTESKMMFCSCSSARFFQSLRQGDVMDLELDVGRKLTQAKEKVLKYVYAPCIESSVLDLLNEECQSSTYLDDYPYISKPTYCTCQNNRNTFLFKRHFAAITQQNMENLDAAISDPISAFLKNKLFVERSAAVTGACMQEATIKVKKLEPSNMPVAPLIGNSTQNRVPPGQKIAPIIMPKQ